MTSAAGPEPDATSTVSDVDVEARIVGPGLGPRHIGQRFTFDSGWSVGPEGVPLMREWSLLERPGGSEAELTSITGESTVLVPDTSGTYRIGLTVSAGGVEDSDEASVTILPCGEPRAVSGTITEDETWAARPGACPVYVVTGDIDLRAVLTIEPGIVVRFESGTQVLVRGGALRAEGTEDAPIIFEGTHDEAGWWRGIGVLSRHAFNRVDHVIVRHGGGGGVSAAIRVGGTSSASHGDLRMTNTRVEKSAAHGLQVNRWGTLVTFADNSFEEIADSTVHIHVSQLGALDHGTDWGEDPSIEVSGERVESDLLLPGLAAPYLFVEGVDLTADMEIEPGARLRFALGTTFLVRSGILRAVGTEDAPIVFEGSRDEAGWWQGIRVAHEHPLNRLDHVIVRHGGGGGVSAAIRVGGVSFWESGNLRMTNTRVEKSAAHGLQVTLSGTLVTFADNSFEEIADSPAHIHVSQLGALDHGTDWGEDASIEVAGERVESDLLLPALAAPYFFPNGLNLSADTEIEPGARLRFGAGTRLQVSGGALRAVGTEDAPIVFEGSHDEAGWWQGILVLFEHPLNRLDHVIVRHGGGAGVSAAIRVGGTGSWNVGDLRVTNTRVEKSAVHGLQVTSAGTLASFADNSFRETAGSPVHLHISHIHRLDTATDWGENAVIEIFGDRIDRVTELGDLGAPFLLSDGLDVRAALDILPGTTLLMGRDTRILVTSGGYVEARGTAEAPITFAGKQAVPGWWHGLWFAQEGARVNILESVHLLHAGGAVGGASAAVIAGSTNQTAGNPQVQIRNSHFDEIGNPGTSNATAVRTASDTRGSFNADVCTANTFGTIHGPVACDYP